MTGRGNSAPGRERLSAMQNTVIVISKPTLGTTLPEDSGFGAEMLEKFLHSLEKQPSRPRALLFMTEGVRVAVRGGPFDLPVGMLGGLGVRLLCCRTCLAHYGIPEDRVLGEVGGMDEIIQVMVQASKVLHL